LYYKRGLVKTRMADFAGATADFDKTLQLDPGHYRAHFSRGYCRSRTGSQKQAIQDIDRSIEMGNNTLQTKAYYSDFITQNLLPLLSTVLQERYKISELSDDRSDAFLLRGLLKNANGESKAALQDLNRAIELSPTSSESYFVRGIIRSSLGDQKGAMIDCNSAVKLNPRHAEAYYLRGIVRYDTGDEQAGCVDLSRAGELGYVQSYKIIGEKCNRVTAQR
jgi:tetratricopeptide (TPR) repeat protein